MSDSLLSSWYVVHTKPRQEFRALEHLTNQNYICFLPILQCKRSRNGRRETHTEPLFPRYMFVQAEDAHMRGLGAIRSTRGVSRLVAFGERLATLPDVCLQSLKQRPIDVKASSFNQGDHVVVTHGPFAGMEGIYQLEDGEARALVLVELLSTPQKLRFAVEMLARQSGK